MPSTTALARDCTPAHAVVDLPPLDMVEVMAGAVEAAGLAGPMTARRYAIRILLALLTTGQRLATPEELARAEARAEWLKLAAECAATGDFDDAAFFTTAGRAA